MSTDYSHLKFTTPANQIKAINVPPVPERIFDGMKQYEDFARGYILREFEYLPTEKRSSKLQGNIYVVHRPADSQTNEVHRIPVDPSSDEFQRLTYFDTGSGRFIRWLVPLEGDNWRGVWRGGGALMAMDLDGNENFQLWRYWEDADCAEVIPKVDGELDNRPGVGRIERLTHDDFKYTDPIVSQSNKILVVCSNKGNKRDTLAYITKLTESNFGTKNDSASFTLPLKLITPLAEGEKITQRWVAESISIDDKYVLLNKAVGSAHIELYILDISGDTSSAPERILLPGATEPVHQTTIRFPKFSRKRDTPNLVHLITDAYGDFLSVISYDVASKTVLHITAPEPNLASLRPIPWNTNKLRVTDDYLFFVASVEGWERCYCMALTDPHKERVVEIKFKGDEDAGFIQFETNARNGRSEELAVRIASYRNQGLIAYLDASHLLDNIQSDQDGLPFVLADVKRYRQASSDRPPFKTLPPQLIKFKSFDGLSIGAMYYHPTGGKSAVPVIINIHGGPESASTSMSRIPIHWYLVNELRCAVVYPNVRGSSGYGKKFQAADDVMKREDSVRDIGALLDYIKKDMSQELDADKIAVMGGSYGGYMVFATMIHYSPLLTCGLANFGISHFPKFLTNTAPQRRDLRRSKYGDERIPATLEYLENISPVNHAEKIRKPLSIAHGETDSRVTVEEAFRMFEIVEKGGVRVELMVCEKEGHGFKQKSVIEFTNAAKIHFLERFLLQKASL